MSSANDSSGTESLSDTGSESDSSSDGEDQKKTNSVRMEILQAALSFVPHYGWTKQSLTLGSEKVGLPGISQSIIDHGPIELVEFFVNSANDELADKLPTMQDPQQQTRQFLYSALVTRLEMLTPYIHQWPHAMAMMALPYNAPSAMKNLTRMVDDMWYYAGDRSTYVDWYTKRAALATIYTSTEVYMVQDNSLNFQNTWNFLDRQLLCCSWFSKRVCECQNMKDTASGLLYSAIHVGRNMMSMNVRRR